jgi:hypothetical protein
MSDLLSVVRRPTSKRNEARIRYRCRLLRTSQLAYPGFYRHVFRGRGTHFISKSVCRLLYPQWLRMAVLPKVLEPSTLLLGSGIGMLYVLKSHSNRTVPDLPNRLSGLILSEWLYGDAHCRGSGRGFPYGGGGSLFQTAAWVNFSPSSLKPYSRPQRCHLACIGQLMLQANHRPARIRVCAANPAKT